MKALRVLTTRGTTNRWRVGIEWNSHSGVSIADPCGELRTIGVAVGLGFVNIVFQLRLTNKPVLSYGRTA